MKLGILITSDKPEVIDEIESYWGEIIIGDFYETIVIPLEYWSLKDYKKQWKEGLKRIKKHPTSCLVATVQDPAKAPLINWWILYREKDTVFIQNHLLVSKTYKEHIGNNLFTPETCYNFIPPRETVFEDGTKVSEWKIALKDI